MSPPPVTPTKTVIISEAPLFRRKLNKKGKPTGKAVLSDFTLDFGVPLNPAAAGNAANYQIDSITKKKSKKGSQTILHPITNFTVSYVPASDAVEIAFTATETFPTGGQITVLSGVTTAAGGTLTGNAVFTISKGGKSVGPVVNRGSAHRSSSPAIQRRGARRPSKLALAEDRPHRQPEQ